MRTLLLILAFAMPAMAMSQDFIPQQKPKSAYLCGAVPETDGQVVFKKTFRVPGHSDAEILQTLTAWMQELVEKSIPAPGQYARIMGTTESSATARVCEWIVFKKKALVLDRARLRYQLDASVKDGRVNLQASQIAYYYGEDEASAVQYRAEEWITDAEAVNKKNTKLYPKSGKFRIFTVDYMDRLWNSAMDAFEVKAPKAEVIVPQRKNIIED